MDKRQLRAEARKRRDAEAPDAGSALSAADHFMAHFHPARDQTVALYWPKPGEFDTRPLIGRLLDAGVACALPVMQEDGLILHFAVWDGRHPLRPSRHGILQPPPGDLSAFPDIVIVPLLAYDDAGGRLGYGGGYYDATLAALRRAGKLTAVGIGLRSQQATAPLPTEAHDQRLDAMLTPDGVHLFA